VLSLLIPCANARGDVGLNDDVFVPNPGATSPIEREMLRFFGKLMGVAIRSKN